MHWTRIALVSSVAITAVGTCLPWLKGVPEGVLTVGSGTIYGITTIHGIIIMVLCAGCVLLAVLGSRPQRIHRGAAVGIMAICPVQVIVASFVIGTTKADILDKVSADATKIMGRAGTHFENLAIIKMAKLLKDFEEGFGGYVLVAGIGLTFLAAVVSLFLKRRPIHQA
jgi:hypothetical protein